MESAISPNERLAQRFHPWTSYVIVPLFALANAGIAINGGFITRAFTSPITLGIVVGYVVGKPLGIVGASLLASRLSRGRLRPPVGWAAVAGGGAVAGIGFTVSLLVAALAFRGAQLQDAKLGVLTAAVLATAVTWAVFRVTDAAAALSAHRALLGAAEPIVDLAVPVDDERDHIRGPAAGAGHLRRVRRFRVSVLRPGRAGGARAAGRFRRRALRVAPPAVERRAPQGPGRRRGRRGGCRCKARSGRCTTCSSNTRPTCGRPTWSVTPRELGLDAERFADDLRRHAGAARIAQDVDGADLSGVSGTPTFFINGRRHYGVYDAATLEAAVRSARVRALLTHGPEAAAAA